MLSSTTDWLELPITTSVDISELDVEVSLSRDSENESDEWWPAEHMDGGVRLMTGPDSDVGRLAAGAWWAYVRVTGLAPRLPVIPAGSFLIEGGPTAAEVGSGATLAFDSDGVPYFQPVLGSDGSIALDSDGVPYIPEEI